MVSSTSQEYSTPSCLDAVPGISDEFAGIYQERILAPPETDFKTLWRDEDPDQVISRIKLLSVKIMTDRSRKQASSKTVAKCTPGPKPQCQSPVISQRTNQTYSPSTRFNTTNRLKFSDVVDSLDTFQIKGSKRWFEKFEEKSIQEMMPVIAISEENRVKIAVLDTGINLKNTFISQNKGRIRCWPNRPDCDDIDGHGTHTAYLLLRLAPHAQIHVAKVSNTKFLRDANIEQIAASIAHFSGRSRVDIINLSFGFPRYHAALKPILTAIRNARSNGVLVFAAAGNDGRNQGVFWPAALHDIGDVIRINSSNGNEKPSDFNPDPGTGRRICTLGEGVPSCQLYEDPPSRTIHRSGTSFATPIAAAIAAIVLAFVNSFGAEREEFEGFDDLVSRLRTPVGVERVLCQACVLDSTYSAPSNGLKSSYITPWFFLARERKITILKILETLGQVPESPTLFVKAF
ncbi:uncharacterized protein EAE97_006876 [Botrytis byssoidea]|uniref:Peptidase S8/S53 domain-containing protein n=1 Tax=Botrytis byssoidea TaxID=139641 RepID=A0A9P5M5V7_9HELO|nr:uncharacterized protein EAE97_006876 [Botrytis byssoidea]KAF7940690.1 hypothetical protein EAE97_006876 [Botrytis byssoidea]